MTFFDYYQSEFINYAKNKKTDKNFKKLKNRKDKTLFFLKDKGQVLKNSLEKYVKENKDIKFSNLPPEVQSYLGRSTVAEIKRKQIFDNNSKLIQISNQQFIFNSGNAIFSLIPQLITNKLYLKRLFIREFFFPPDGIELIENTNEYRQLIVDLIEIFESDEDPVIIGNNVKIVPKALKEELMLFSKENGDGKSASWTLYGLYSVKKQHKGKFFLIVNIEDYIDSP